MIDKISVLFEDRNEATDKLMRILPLEKMKNEEWVVIASSPNGIPVAQKIANTLEFTCDLMFTEKILAPLNKDCEIAIVTESEEVVIHEEVVKAFEIELDYIFEIAKNLKKKVITKKIDEYRNGRFISDLSGKNILLVDEGLNTGLTMMACIKTAINLGAKSVSVAVPVMPEATIADIESIADDLYCVHKLSHFVSIDVYYRELENIVLENLEKGNICRS